MSIIEAIILGIIEGLTEFLPISSTGHLTIAEKLLGFKIDSPFITTNLPRGISGLMSLRLCSRAPRIIIESDT
jgi:hypothetical protein